MSIWRWAEWLEPVPVEARITLGEGNTPLLRSRHIGPQAGLKNLFFKNEIANPSGTYKDRFAVVAVAHMLARGQTRCIATSSGNTGAALAAYCAAAAIRCDIAIVETAPEGKLKQMQAYGAQLHRIRGFGLSSRTTDEVFACLQELSRQPAAALQISSFKHSPAGMTGVKSISFELAEQSEEPIDHVFCQSGGGGLALGVARGFEDLVRRGRLDRSPRIECVQPVGNNTIAGPLRDGAERAQDVEATTKISGLQVASVVDGHEVIAACRRTGGSGHLVEDEFVYEVQQALARDEGIFAEPAAVVSLAGALQAVREGRVDPGARIVCTITGSAFKDPPSIDRMVRHADCPIIDAAMLRERIEKGSGH